MLLPPYTPAPNAVVDPREIFDGMFPFPLPSKTPLTESIGVVALLLNVKVLSTNTFGEDPFNVRTPLSVVPVNDKAPVAP
jgi:hypothetical protein